MMNSLAGMIAQGGAAQVSPDLARLTGKALRDFRSFAREHAAAWHRGARVREHTRAAAAGRGPHPTAARVASRAQLPARYTRGLQPSRRLNCRSKCAALTKPQAAAISAMGRRDWRSCTQASLTRRSFR